MGCVNSWCEFCSQRVVSQLGTQLTSVSLTALLKQKAIMLKTLLQPWRVVIQVWSCMTQVHHGLTEYPAACVVSHVLATTASGAYAHRVVAMGRGQTSLKWNNLHSDIAVLAQERKCSKTSHANHMRKSKNGTIPGLKKKKKLFVEQERSKI